MSENSNAKLRLIAELGSCHMGRLDRIKEAIDLCKAYQLDALKLQLFPNEAPYVPTNIYLPREMFTAAFEYAKERGVCLSASVFDEDSFRFLLFHRPSFIKFSFGKKDQTEWIRETIAHGIEAIVSCDVLSDHFVPERATKLYCIPEYPVRYEVTYDEIFPRFDGFSDHTLGMRQTAKAVVAGATLVEKHVKLGYEDETCPDAFFAVNIRDLGKLREIAKV
jgi:sialic acid synthase SpsE